MQVLLLNLNKIEKWHHPKDQEQLLSFDVVQFTIFPKWKFLKIYQF